MEMTIDEAIAHVMDVICENNTIKHSDLVVFNNEKQALRIAAETMRKYQKIEELISDYEGYKWDEIEVSDIRRILDGKID